MKHATDRVEVIPSGGALGAEIRGLDLRLPLDAATVGQLRRALLDHCVLVFRGQPISEADQVRFTGYFGRPVEHVRRQPDRPVKEIFLISNIEENGQPIGALGHGELSFHSDLSYLRRPGTLSLLYAVEVPESGGSTQWCNGYAAYEELDDDLRTRVHGSAPSIAIRSRTRTRPSRWTTPSCARTRRPAAGRCTWARTSPVRSWAWSRRRAVHSSTGCSRT